MDSAQTSERIAKREEYERQEQRRKDHERWQAVVRTVGKRYAGCTLESFSAEHQAQRAAVAACREFCDDIAARTDAGRGLVFIGPKGTGKDHLMVACARIAVTSGLTAEFADGQTLFQEFRDVIDSETRERDAIARYTTPNILMLSDPIPADGAKGDYQRSILWRIVDGRYRWQRPTWVTLNVANGADAESKISPQIVDRLRDGATVIECNWPSYRRVGTK